jgi:hypothetical protein
MSPLRRLLLTGAVALAAAALPAAASAATPTKWLCLPGASPDPCTPGLSTTRFSPAGQNLGTEHPKADRKPKVDCFYVYPTVSDQPTPVANLDIDPVERSIALYQAARYSQHCRVFAPVYRQFTLSAISSGKVDATATSVGYKDVRQAWRTYLRKYNKGRGVVLIGHSQGSFVLRQLIAQEIDPKKSARNLLVGAYLLGGNVTVKQGQDKGGDFKHLRACHSAKEAGCIVAFSTFDEPAPADSIFGRTSVPGQQVMCTNPAALGGGSATLDTIFPTQPFAPGSIFLGIQLLGAPLPTAPTTWIEVKDGYRAECSDAGGANVLEITPLNGAPDFKPSPTPQWGLHLVDANIALGDLVDLVRTQAAAWRKHGHHHSRPSHH